MRDAEARLRAQTDFRAPLLVEAGAGSGKTSILVARIVAWSLGPGWQQAETWFRERGDAIEPDRVAQRTLSRVVAITFTDAAAAEMAHRVGEWLARIAAGDDPVEVAAEALPEASLRRTRAEALRSSLDRLVVRTIHAFCRRLLAECPMEAGLHPAFEVDADEERTAHVVREVVEQAIPEAYGDPAAPLSRLAVAGEDPRRIEPALFEFVRSGTPAAALQQDPFSEERVTRFVEQLRQPFDRFHEIEGGRLEVTGSKHEAALKAVRKVRDVLASKPSLPVLLERLNDLWEEKLVDQVRREWVKKGHFSVKGNTILGTDREALSAVSRLLHTRLKHALQVDPASLELARRALAPLAEEVETRLRAGGVQTFSALLRDTRELVEGHPHVARRIRAGIDQLLVDEFQDTDDVQCAIVRALALDGEEADRPGLFLVGDPRQSIYGWRSADLRAYDAFVERVQAAGGERLFLTRNFRSLPAVLEEVRRCIEPVMVEEPGVQPPFQRLDAHRAEEGVPGRVEHWLSWQWDDDEGAPPRTRVREAIELEANALAEDVARIARDEGVAWKDVAVLFRAMTQVDVYLDALREAGIPYTVERDRRYYQRREVIEASALLRAVLDPQDHVALVAWLRSASVGTPDAAWTALWAREFPAAMSRLQGTDEKGVAARLAEVRACIDAAAAAVDPAVPGLDRIAGWDALLREAVATLADLRRALHAEPSDAFIERLRTATLIEATEAARYLGPYRVANLDQFFRDVREDLEETGGDISEVMRRIRVAVETQAEVEEARPREAADDAVRIMSIHKAKGLDFRHVYLAQLHKASGGHASGTKLGRGGEAGDYRLFGSPSLGFGSAAEQDQATAEAEQVRTLYVAMTRARDRLVLMGKHPMKGDLLRDSHASLLAERRRAEREPEERMALLASRREAFEVDGAGVLWRFPGLAPARPERVATAAFERALPDAAAIAAGTERLAARCAEALKRKRRPRSQAASALAHEAVRDDLQARNYPVEGEPTAGPARVPRDAVRAAAVGTALHAALERWPGDVASAREIVDAALAALLPAGEQAEAAREAGEILERFVASPLFTRFETLGDRVVARELPVLLPPREEDDATGHVVGAVDLLYRDDDGALVVADYKSDVVAGPEDLAERTGRYAAQGGAYVRAVRDALALAEEPRFELWFLSEGACIPVPR